MSDKTITLTHPKLGDQEFPEAQARKLMAMANNGGWEFKKSGVVKATPELNQKDVANTTANKGEAGSQTEKGSNQKGD